MASHGGPRAGRPDTAQALSGLQVAIVGAGLLASAIADAVRTVPGAGRVRGVFDLPDMSDLSDLAELVGEVDQSRDGRLLVTASDGWDCRAFEQVQALCVAHRTSWMPVRTELGRTVIGPYFTPGIAGCSTCAELRRSLADDQFAVRESVRQKYPTLADQPSPWLTTLAAETVAAVTAEEISRSARSVACRTRCALVYVDLDTLAVDTHRFLPDPLCPECGVLPDDTAQAARIVLGPRPKPAPGSYRIRQLGEADLDRLRDTYVDGQVGLIRRVETFTSGGLAVGAAEMRTRWQTRAEHSWGRTFRHQTSEIVAVLEALERYGGMAPGGRRSAVRASFAEVRDSAVDPRSLGLYPPGHYARPGFHFQPFDVDRMCRWVWGYSFARGEPILVPQAYAYYRAHAIDPDDPSFAYEVSNGCALGGCLEEAILYGLLEVVERDAFLMTWYARLPAARVDLSSARDRAVPMLAALIEAETNYRLLAFDTTMEHGIPSLWAMAVCPIDTEPPGQSSRPALVCSAGAHLDPEHAARGALSELGPILADLIARYPDDGQARAMASDPSLVVTMDDHSALYADHEAATRLDFLTAGAAEPPRSFADIRSRCGTHALRAADLTDDLTEVVLRLRGHGLDVVVVDQTTPEHRAGGFCCVKVIVPGMLPMTFGHHNRRVHGLPRLFEVPRLLGYRDRAMAPHEVNPHPHPFP